MPPRRHLGCKSVECLSLTLHAVSRSSNGFGIGPASYVTVEDTKVTNGDDCVVLKPGARYVTVSGVTCVGSYGLSVGSLAGGAGSDDIVTNSIFGNCTMMKGAGKIEGVVFERFTGTTSGKHGSVVANIDCYTGGSCGIRIADLQVTAPKGKAEVLCANTPSTLGVKCTAGASG